MKQISALRETGTCVDSHDEPDDDDKNESKQPKTAKAKGLSASATARSIAELRSPVHAPKNEGFTVGTYIHKRKKDPSCSIQAWQIKSISDEKVSLKPYELMKDHPVIEMPLADLKLFSITSNLAIPTPVTGWGSPYDNKSWSMDGIRAQVFFGWDV